MEDENRNLKIIHKNKVTNDVEFGISNQGRTSDFILFRISPFQSWIHFPTTTKNSSSSSALSQYYSDRLYIISLSSSSFFISCFFSHDNSHYLQTEDSNVEAD